MPKIIAIKQSYC